MAQRTDFEYSTVPAGEPGPGEALLRVLYLSLYPAMRGWMNESRSRVGQNIHAARL
jgi:NADPH-dependent curcumin reductase CurA